MKRVVLSAVLVLVISITVLAVEKVLEFREMVNCSVIDRAIDNFAAEVKDNGASVAYQGLVSTANYWARHSAYEEVLGDEYYRKLWDAFDAHNGVKEESAEDRRVYGVYRNILEVARAALNTPTGLKAAYKLHRSRALGKIKQAGVAEEAKAELEKVLPYFQGTLPAEKELLLEWYVGCQKILSAGYLSPGAWHKIREDLSERGIGEGEVYIYQWVERRRAEGGQPLLNAYCEIIQHAIKCLS